MCPPRFKGRGGSFDPARAKELADQPTLIPDTAAGAWLRARYLVGCALNIAAEQHFFHWQVGFPGVWSGWRDSRQGGFDAVIGNPPWDRMEFKEVSFFALRDPAIAKMKGPARKVAISALAKARPVLRTQYELAKATVDAAVKVARKSGAYPLLSGGKLNIYKLFIERASGLIRPNGVVGLLCPSGITGDQSSSRFVEALVDERRLSTFLDFENRGLDTGLFFPDVDSRFKLCVLGFGGQSRKSQSLSYGAFLKSDGNSIEGDFTFDIESLKLYSPITATIPILRSQRDFDLTKSFYERFPLLGGTGNRKSGYRMSYSQMVNLTNGPIIKEKVLADKGGYLVSASEWRVGRDSYRPVYEGKMVAAYDHRALDVGDDEENFFRQGSGKQILAAEREDPNRVAVSTYWISDVDIHFPKSLDWLLAFKDISSPTNYRGMIASILPRSGVGNSLPVLLPRGSIEEYIDQAPYLLANFNSIPFDYVARTRIQGQHLNWYIVEQLPVILTSGYDRAVGDTTAGGIVRDHVLRLSYTAHDLAPLARDLGWVYTPGDLTPDGATARPGDVRPPFLWNEDQRRLLRARLDALFFILYGVTDPDDVRHILSTFPIVRRKDVTEHGVYLTELLILWFMRALKAGDWTRDPPIADLIAAARRAA